MSSTFNIKHVPYNCRDNQILTVPNFKNIKDLSNITELLFWTIYLEIKAANNITTLKKLV